MNASRTVKALRLGRAAAFLVLGAPVQRLGAQEAASESGRQIAERAIAQLKGYGDVAAEITIVLKARRGDARTWTVRLLSLEQPGVERTIVVFERPRDVRGTALLTATRPGRENEQWLYLPAVGRVKRIASQGRSSSFMGTEFSYEDVAPDDAARYRYGETRADTLDGVPVTAVERFPQDPGSAYGRQLLWVDGDDRPIRIDYFDRAGSQVKTLHYRGYRLRAGRFWRADEMEMVNHKTLASTTLLWTAYRFGAGLRASDFEPDALGRTP
ncbi:MAG TPA: outer membrane lipoprotein-sorting protein [Gemmatimonadales bacterium]|nr:outer membrane lipoprotein-sorting protein [Gemmatimonadales bacterium]